MRLDPQTAKNQVTRSLAVMLGVWILPCRWWKALEGNGTQMSGLQIILVASVKDELEVYSGEKDSLRIVEA